jgi:hypothetical protein
MLGKTQCKADTGANCAKVNSSGHFQPFAPHTPYLPYPSPSWSN